MIILPIWLWLLLFAIAMVISAIAWLRKTLVVDPRSARAVRERRAIPDDKLRDHCRSSIIQHELTAPGQTNFIAFLEPLEFTSRSGRVRTPISMMLSERTMGISYKKGSFGKIEAMLLNKGAIQSGRASDGPNGFFYAIETARRGSLRFQLQSGEDRYQLASWTQAALADRR
jgi:hypothetical protein